MKKIRGKLLLSAIIGFLILSLNSTAAELLRNGKSRAVIVVGEKSPESIRLAARELQKQLKNLTGEDFRIVTDREALALSGKTRIVLGENALTKKVSYKKAVFPKGSSGYEVKVQGDLVILNGPVSSYKRNPLPEEKRLHPQGCYQFLFRPDFTASDNGVMHAVSAFLEELGVRFYAPGKEGTYYPSRGKDLLLRDLHIVKQAAFPVREYVFNSPFPLHPEVKTYMQMLKYGSSHYPAGVLSLDDIMQEHKDLPHAKNKWGEKLVALNGSGVPLYADKAFRKICVERMRKILDADPELKAIQVIALSTRGFFDFRELVNYTERESYPAPWAEHSIYLDFRKALALELEKTHPGKKILFHALGNGKESKRVLEGLPGNLQGSPSPLMPHSYVNASRYLKFLPRITKTFGKDKGIQREYWNEFDSPRIPRQGFFFLKALQSIRLAQKEFLHGTVMDLPAAPFGKVFTTLAEKELMNLILYVNAKLLWDPSLDLEKLLSGYFLHYYGPAAAAMRNFFSYGEYVYTRGGSRTISQKSGALRETDVHVFFELLRMAKAKTLPGTLYRKRIDALEKSLQWMKTAFAQTRHTGKAIAGEIIPWNAGCNGDLTKYKKFYPLAHGDVSAETRTEFAVAARECRSNFLLAVRCYETDMKRIKRSGLKEDSHEILKYDHIRVLFRSSRNGPCEVILSSSGAVMDRTWDPAAVGGNALLWNSATHRGTVRYYKDRWEGEIAFGSIGQFPDWNPAWGIRIERVRIVNGKKFVVSSCEGPRYDSSKWNHFTIPKADSAGRPTLGRDMVNLALPGVPDGEVYVIRRAPEKLNFSAKAWEDPARWGKAPEGRLGNILHFYYRSNKAGYHPDPSFKMLYDDQYLYVFYKVRDRYVRAVNLRDQGMVCLDSCMEFFIMPQGSSSYFNFEMNCLGTLLLYKIAADGNVKGSQRIPMEELKKIKRFSSLPRKVISPKKAGDTVWYAGLQIPLEFFRKYANTTTPLKGQVWTGNIFKCADWTSHPCWMAWRKTVTFHDINGFGKFIFE